MLKISKKVEYALMILNKMSSCDGQSVTAKSISDQLSIPFDTTSKVLQVLKKNRIVVSTQGASGGYELCSKLDEVNYIELNEMIEEKHVGIDCVGQKCSMLGTCTISTPITHLNNYAMNFFKQINISDLLKSNIHSEDTGSKIL